MYEYSTEREKIFTDEGQKLFLKVRDAVKELLKTSKVFRMDFMPKGIGAIDSWEKFACIDRMIELGELVEVDQVREISEQERIFTSA